MESLSHEDFTDLARPNDTYFFQQSTFRRAPKRFKKHPEELPQDLRYAHLNPRVAAYLANKEKEKEEYDDSFGRKSLLPQITETVNLIRHQLNSALSNDEDSQRYLFEETRLVGPNILILLSKVLYNFAGIKVNIPKTLENLLLSGHRDLTADVQIIPREWQLQSNKEEHIQKLLNKNTPPNKHEDSRDGTTPLGSSSNLSILGGATSRMGDDDTRSVKSAKSAKSSTKDSDVAPNSLKPHKTAQSRSKVLVSRTSNLSDIAEHEHEGRDSRAQGRPVDQMPTILQGKREGERDSKHRPKTRLEKYRSLTGIDPRDVRLGSARRSHRGDETSTLAETTSESGKSLIDKSGFYTILQFQLSAKACENWVVPQDPKEDRERETLLEQATQRLKKTILEINEQNNANKELGLDKPVTLRYYGDSRKEALIKYGRRQAPKSAPVLSKNYQPRIPEVEDDDESKQLFMASQIDGSINLYYPSGRPAILSGCLEVGKNYTLIYEDSAEGRMLGCFTPSGRGCIYHDSGMIRFLCSDKGGTLADIHGAITRRWEWPTHGAKLSASINFQLNDMLSFRCLNAQQMTVHFTCENETAKVSVGMVPGAEEPKTKEDLGFLVTSFSFTSQAAKESTKNYKPKAAPKEKKSKQKNKDKKEKQIAELKTLLDLPEQTENDPEADVGLHKLQRKIKCLVEDWMEHYRMAVGITSPHLRTLRDVPLHRSRQVQSAKSSPAGVRVIIESMATQVAKPTVEPRVPSAPAGRTQDRIEPDRIKTTRPASVGKDVKFDDNPIEVEPDDQSLVRTTPFPSSGSACGSAGTISMSMRSKSAPHRLMATPPADGAWMAVVGHCPVALRSMMLGEERATCKCSRHKIPYITDIEYDELVMKHAPMRQLIILAVISSLYPKAQPSMDMLEKLYGDRNRNRTRPCLQSRGDSFRLFLYDVASAAQFTDHTQPLLLRRHNVVPGMFLMYEGGKLVFCDHIFNGYGNARKDFQKQMMQSRRSASLGQTLPRDFRFSPLHGRHGPRSGWGGEIGGTGVDHHGSAGISLETEYLRKGPSCSSITNSDSSSEQNFAFLSGPNSAVQFISLNLSSSGYHEVPGTKFLGSKDCDSPTIPDIFGPATGALPSAMAPVVQINSIEV